MNWNSKTGLVLEGGGMRGAFTAGVLDFFLDVIFPSREGEDLRPIRIIWMMKIIAALKAC